MVLSEKCILAIKKANKLMLVNFIYEEDGQFYYMEWRKSAWREPTKIDKL